MIAVKVSSLTKTYVNGNSYTKAINNISLEIEKGEFVAITGPSGSGKTTLLNMIGGLDRPSQGSILVNGIAICDLDEEELCIFRRDNIGFVFQNYNLLPAISAYENIVLPQKLGRQEIDKEWIDEISEAIGIRDYLWQMPGTMSGGQKQRVAIVRALSTRPAIILADEPTGNLDVRNGREVIALLQNLSRQYGQTVAVITHNEEIALRAERVIQIEDGKVL